MSPMGRALVMLADSGDQLSVEWTSTPEMEEAMLRLLRKLLLEETFGTFGCLFDILSGEPFGGHVAECYIQIDDDKSAAEWRRGLLSSIQAMKRLLATLNEIEAEDAAP
jgi:hypothetical protein